MLSLSFSPPAMAMILALCPPTPRHGQGTFSHLPCRTHKPLPLRLSTFGSPLHLCAAPGIAFRAFFPIAQHRRLAVASSDDAEIAKEDALPDPEALPYEVYQTLHVECWGTVYTGPNEKKYWNWNNMYPYPVGYVAMKSYKRRNYRQTITEGPDGPLFVLEEIGKGSFTSDSPAKVWKLAIPTENGLVNGARHFGFRSPEVISILQAMAAKVKKSGGEEVSNEEKAEHKGTEESILNDQFVLDASTSEEDHEFAEDETLEEEQNNLSFDVYSTETPSAEDESVGFDETGTLLNNFKLPIDSKNSTIRDELDNFELSSSQQFTLDSENDTPDIDSANNGVYHPSFSRPKTVEIWKRGQGIGSGKPQFLDRPGVEQWSSSGYGLNGSKSWETSSLKKKRGQSQKHQFVTGTPAQVE